MTNNSIGFRLKFDDMKPEDIEKFLFNYLKIFNRFEIKVTKNLISSGGLEYVLSVSKKIADGKYSIHLLKDILTCKSSYEDTIQTISKMKNLESTKKIMLITHLPFQITREQIECIFQISKILPQNCLLLLENMLINKNNYEYLRKIDKLCLVLDEKNIKNVGMCLDFGHMLFGFHKEGIKEKNVFLFLKKMPNINSKIYEIHIHDYLERDHMQLQKGRTNFTDVSKFIKSNNLNVPIIIETNVRDAKRDGIEQVKSLKKFLSV